jgi:hypothetical protein
MDTVTGEPVLMVVSGKLNGFALMGVPLMLVTVSVGGGFGDVYGRAQELAITAKVSSRIRPGSSRLGSFRLFCTCGAGKVLPAQAAIL